MPELPKKSGHKCPDCQTVLDSIRMDQRQTTFCPHCQPYEQ